MEVIARCSRTLPAPLESLKFGKTIGRGGFAIVKSGVLKTADGLTFPIAVKVLHPEYSGASSAELRLFKEEARLLLQIDHRNIVAAYGLLRLPSQFPGLEGHTLPAYALVLEMMEGGSLASLMVKQLLAGSVPKYTFSQALGWVIDISKALQYLHNGGKDGFPRIHRDVKLENVLLATRMGTAKLADFGLQKAIVAQEQQAMLVRRSQLQFSLCTLPEARTGTMGPSRLAPESERPTNRTQRPVLSPVPTLLDIPDSPTFEPQGSLSDVTNLPTLNGLFYTVDDKGLTPLMLPTTPPATVHGCAATPTASPLPTPCKMRATRRSTSLSKLGAVPNTTAARQPASPAGSPQPPLADTMQPQGTTTMPGQLPSDNRNLLVTAEAITATQSFLVRQWDPSSRFPSFGSRNLLGPTRNSTFSVARPSPLGLAASISVILTPAGTEQGEGSGETSGLMELGGGRTTPLKRPGDAAPSTPERFMTGDRGALTSGYDPSVKGGSPLTALSSEPNAATPLAETAPGMHSAACGKQAAFGSWPSQLLTPPDSTGQHGHGLPGSMGPVNTSATPSGHKSILVADALLSTETKITANGIAWVGDFEDTNSLTGAPVSITAHVWGPQGAGTPVDESVAPDCGEAAVKGPGENSDNGMLSGDAHAPISEPLQQTDLLTIRLGALGLSVRSVRNTGSSLGTPQRRAAAVAVAAIRAEGVGPHLGQRAGDAAVHHRRVGSLPGVLAGKIAAGGLQAVGADFEEVFTLTGRTGSLMYLAPEAYKNEPYNDKVDVYSLAVLMYELFGRTSITYTHISTKLPAFSRMLCTADEFANRVAAGYRPPRTNNMRKMPPGLWELIEAAWHQDPVQRPDIDAVVAALEALKEPLAASEAANGNRKLMSSGCGCVIS